jgi:hypothetical protein
MSTRAICDPSSFIILAPADAEIPSAFSRRSSNGKSYDRILCKVQKLRGRIAFDEGAVREQDLLPEYRHEMDGDAESWHLVRVDENENVLGCARILVHPDWVDYFSLRVSRSAIATDGDWRSEVREAVEKDMRMARDSGMMIVEPGGWVIDESLRGKTEAIELALSAFAWSQLVGGCLAYVTATVKHHSAAMLRRLGGSPLRVNGKTLPSYYDRQYDCEMEILKIETGSLNPRFEPAMAPLRTLLSLTSVIQAEAKAAAIAA